MSKIRVNLYIFVIMMLSVSLLLCGGCSPDIQSEETSLETEEPVSDTEEQEPEEQETEEQGTGNDQPAQVKSITVEEVYDDIQKDDPEFFILDVRTQEEYMEGYIQGAKLIPVSELGSRLDDLPADTPIVVYCRSGSRSASAAEMLVENGFSQVYDMGGILEWIDNGYPVVMPE